VDAFPYTTSSNQVDHLQESDLNTELFPEQIQNHRYENYTFYFYLKEYIHKYKTTGMKTTLFTD
jgi:hypothetical protein